MKQHLEQEIANLVLNYLRISLVARVISGVKDMDFVRQLSTPEGRALLSSGLKSLSESISGDPLQELSFKPKPKGVRVFVDAKIVGRHDPSLPKRTVVGYFVDGPNARHAVKEVLATETDDAELHAVAFALTELKDKIEQFTIVCDHDSVVSSIKRKNRRLAKRRPILTEVLNELNAHPLIQIESLSRNPAHKILNDYLTQTPEAS